MKRLFSFLAALAVLAAPLEAVAQFSKRATTGFNTGNFVTVEGPGRILNYTDGWALRFSQTPVLGPLVIYRQGFDDTGATIFFNETQKITANVRQVYPNQGPTLQNADPHLASSSDYIYRSDVVPGGVNNSDLISPAPVCNWFMLSRSVVTTTITGEIRCNHRNARGGRGIRTVILTATDGSHTATTTVAATAVSSDAGDMANQKVEDFPFTLSLSGFTNPSTVTLNGKAYPWVGEAASVADSSLSSDPRAFSPRYFLLDTARAASPWLAKVSAAGNDSNACANQTYASITLTCLTTTGALTKINTGGGKTDGAIVYCVDTCVAGNSVGALTQNIACVTVTRDPSTAKASAIFSFGSGSYRPKLTGSVTIPTNESCTRFYDMTIVRNGASTLQGESTVKMNLQFQQVTFDNGATSSASWFSNSSDYMDGVVFTNLGSTTLATTANGQHRMMRGVDASATSNTLGAIDTYIVASSFLPNAALGPLSGASVVSNIISKVTTGSIGMGTSADVSQIDISTNVLEYIGTANSSSARVSGDGATGNNSHIIEHNNTFVGYWDYGRWNEFYDDIVVSGTRRLSQFQSVVANLIPQFNLKTDVFVALNESNPTEAPFRIQNWAPYYGVGFSGNFYDYNDANSGTPPVSNFGQAFAGVNTTVGTSSTVPAMANSKFTSYQATSWSGSGTTPTAGAGNGTYTLTTGAAVKGIVPVSVASFDLLGNARPLTNSTAGAYEAP